MALNRMDETTVRIVALGRTGRCSAERPESTVRDGLALSVSSILGAVAGLVGWLIAARLLPRPEVGLAAAAVSAFMLVGGLTQLNLGVALLRWLPAVGRFAQVVVWRSLLSVVPLGALGGMCYALAVPSLAHVAGGPHAPYAAGVLVFSAAAACWSAWVVHDYVLVAVGRPMWAVWRNGLFAVTRLALLVVLGAPLGAHGVALSWVIPVVAFIAAGSVVLAVVVRTFAARQRGGTLPARSEVIGFVGPTWLAQAGNNLLLSQVPLLVILRFGPDAGAAFFIVWQATVVMDTAATYFTHSLSARWAREPGRGPELAAATRRQLLTIFLPLLAMGAVLAGPGLSIFGPGYAAAANVLRLLLLGLAFRLIVVHELAVRTAGGHAVAYARLHLVSTLLVLLTTAIVPVLPGPDVAATLMPVAVGYVAVQTGCAAHVLIVRALRSRSSPGPLGRTRGVRGAGSGVRG